MTFASGLNGAGTCRVSRGENYVSVMTTGVPISTWWKSHSASEMCIRMQPCEAE